MSTEENKRIVRLVFEEGFNRGNTAPADEYVAEGDRVVWRWTVRGTDTGGFMGKPATGKRIEVTGVNIQRLANGLIVEHWSFPDLLELQRQLGVALAAEPQPARA